MIIDTGMRTDTVKYFSPWLLKRFEEGYVLVRNPLFPKKVSRYELDPGVVDVVMFCSKDYAPILPRLHEITDRFPSYFHYTITAYGKDIEPGIPSIDQSIDTLLALEKIVGKDCITWRYDPVLLTSAYTIERHLQTFESMCDRLAGHVDRCIFGFVESHRKLESNMPELIPLEDWQKDELAKGIGRIAGEHVIPIQTCGANGDFTAYGIVASGCCTLDILGQANGLEFRKLKHKGYRQGCQRIESRDIGAYDTCVGGCKYCYASKDPRKACENFQLHDPDSPLLLGHLKDTDVVIQGAQKSFLKNTTGAEEAR